jgi:CheY-like chemotaxis protein
MKKVWKALVSEDVLTQAQVMERCIKGLGSALFTSVTSGNTRQEALSQPRQKKDYLESA